MVSLTSPVFTHSIQALAAASIGSQTASVGLSLNSAGGFASYTNKGASDALHVSIDLSV